MEPEIPSIYPYVSSLVQGTEWWWIVATVLVIVAMEIMATMVIIRRRKKRGCISRLPMPLPSPGGRLPLFGHMLHLLLRSRGFPHRWFHTLSQQYTGSSPFLLLWFGRVPVLLVSSAPAARLILHDHDLSFASRASTSAARLLLYGPADLAFTSYGPYWRKVKEVYMTKLFNATRLREFAPIRAEELARLISSISTTCAAPQLIRSKVFDMAFDNISRMAFASRACDLTTMFSDPSLDFMKVVHDILMLVGVFNIGDFVPALRWLDLQGYERQIQQTHMKIDVILQRIIDDTKEKAKNSTSVPTTTILDTLLLSFDGSNDVSKFQDDSIKAIILDLFVGGTDTTATTIEWALSELLKNKEIMTKLQEELDNVLGKDQTIRESYIPNLPFLQAVVKETLRLHSPGSLLIPHEAIRSCEVAGYYVPNKTQAIVNIWAISRDESVWEKPFEFLPHRFLNSTLDVKGHHYQLLPFGAGRRACPAMNLGLISVQLVLAALIHCFEWSLPGGMDELDMSEKFGLTLHKAIPLIAMARPRLSKEFYESL